MLEKSGIHYNLTKILLSEHLEFIYDFKLIINKLTISPTK